MKLGTAGGSPPVEKPTWHSPDAAPRRPREGAPDYAAPAQFLAALALWAAPAIILMRFDLLALPERLFAAMLRHDPAVAVALAVALAYAIATAFLVAATARQLVEARSRWLKSCVFLIASPPIALSLAVAPLLALLCFTSIAMSYLPGLP